MAAIPVNTTRTVEVPKQLVVDVLDQRLQGVRIHVENFGPRRRTGKDLSWREDRSWIERPGGTREAFGVPEQQYKRRHNSVRKWKSYIRDLRSSGLTVAVEGGALVLRVAFESEGAELRTMCLRWRVLKKRWDECKAWGGPERDSQLDDARVRIRLQPVAHEGGIGYRPLGPGDVRFEAKLRLSGKLCARQEWLCQRMEQNAYPEIRQAVEAAVIRALNDAALRRRVAAWIKGQVEPLVRQLLGVQGEWKVVSVEDAGASYRVTVGWLAPLVGERVVPLPEALEIVSFAVEGERAAMACPGTVRFRATVRTRRDRLKGEVYIKGRLGNRPVESRRLRWQRPAKGTSSFTLTLPWKEGFPPPMRYVDGEVQLNVIWEDASRPGGRRLVLWRTETFQRACRGAGGLSTRPGTPETRPPRPPRLAPQAVPQRPPPRPVPPPQGVR